MLSCLTWRFLLRLLSPAFCFRASSEEALSWPMIFASHQLCLLGVIKGRRETLNPRSQRGEERDPKA